MTADVQVGCRELVAGFRGAERRLSSRERRATAHGRKRQGLELADAWRQPRRLAATAELSDRELATTRHRASLRSQGSSTRTYALRLARKSR